MNTNNSISTLIKQLLEINSNNINTFERINEAVTTNKREVPLEILTEDGETKTLYVPSFGYLKEELERLNNNIKSLSGIGEGSSVVKLPDGTTQQIVTSQLETPATSINTINNPTTFETKSNRFFENYLNPLLQVSFDLTNQVPKETERVLVKKYIIDSSIEESVNWFDVNYINSSEVDYDQLKINLANDNIAFFEEEEIVDLPYISTRYYGAFDVTSIDTQQLDEDGSSTTVKLFSLNKLTYTDSEKEQRDTEFLKKGDQLIINNVNTNTRYQVESVETSTNQVRLSLVEGFEPISIGSDILRIYKANDNELNVKVNIGFDQRLFVFFKPIDPHSHIIAENWSPGTAFHTNQLTSVKNGSQISLNDYYKQSVNDFGKMIKGMEDDPIPPSTFGLKPNVPDIREENFEVVQINKHLTDNDTVDQIKKLNADKINAQENIKKIDTQISEKTQEITNKKYTTQLEKDKDNNELISLKDQRSAEVNLYSSVVNEIDATAKNFNIPNVKPKFRIRGFWPIPEPKMAADTIPQEVVQFVIQYRYVSTTGKPSNANQINFNDGNEEKVATFSNWNEIKSGVRVREKNEDGQFVWKNKAIEDGNEVNFNQLDIPIQTGEIVEFRVKSLSESGFPSNPIESDWSDIARIQFPEGEVDATDVSVIVNENNTEKSRVKLLEELESKGVYKHVDESFSENENYFAHKAESISSGFFTPERNPVPLFDKLKDIQNEIDQLKESIEGVKGELNLRIVDEEGRITNIKKNTNNKIFAGYYADEVADLKIKKGHIVTKSYSLVLQNPNATPLEIIARITGDREKPAHHSSGQASTTINGNGFGTDPGNTDLDDKIQNDNYYKNEAKYDMVPIQYQSLNSEELKSDYNAQVPYQSAQKRGQFIYSRFKDVAGEENLYTYLPDTTLTSADELTELEHIISYGTYNGSNGNLITNGPNSATSADYIWNGSFNIGSNSNNSAFNQSVIDVAKIGDLQNGEKDYNNGLFLHKDHPELKSLFNNEYNNNSNEVALQHVIDSAKFTMSKFATKTAEKENAKQQLAFMVADGNKGTVKAGNNGRTLKMSFADNDQYLLGGNSCGAFLYMSPIDTQSLLTDGDNKFGKKLLEQGESNSISIDIIFQYRMTDYAGNNPESDIGRIGGIMSEDLSNLTYTKKIGIDIFDRGDRQFLFDLEVFAKYIQEGSNKNSVKSAQLVSNSN